ncbi:hypothetical protein [Streptomyces sp. LS1784]|uniref:hypothetical protein n=1 Tax=Streptomyces sp. LS1784 TaxID=2851533 RepID=UPI001CCB2B5A|nr:hypothetical protein [Streptomyces sp. LS1784]
MNSTNPDGTDPAAKPKRRTFTAEYKLRVLEQYEAASSSAERGALLRRERLYHSHIQEWRAAREAGALERLADHRKSPSRPKKTAAEIENEKLRRENERLKRELAKNKAAVEVLGKAVALLESVSESAD